ncbi:MAG: hypothetical protein RR744_00415 [Cellulosilyticaceae bacterium]
MNFKVGDRLIVIENEEHFEHFHEKECVVVEVDNGDDGTESCILVDFEERIGKYTHDGAGSLASNTGYWFFKDPDMSPSFYMLERIHEDIEFDF